MIHGDAGDQCMNQLLRAVSRFLMTAEKGFKIKTSITIVALIKQKKERQPSDCDNETSFPPYDIRKQV